MGAQGDHRHLGKKDRGFCVPSTRFCQLAAPAPPDAADPPPGSRRFAPADHPATRYARPPRMHPTARTSPTRRPPPPKTAPRTRTALRTPCPNPSPCPSPSGHALTQLVATLAHHDGAPGGTQTTICVRSRRRALGNMHGSSAKTADVRTPKSGVSRVLRPLSHEPTDASSGQCPTG